MRGSRNPMEGQPESMVLVGGFEAGSGAAAPGGPPAMATLRLTSGGVPWGERLAIPFDLARELARALEAIAAEAGCPTDPSTN